jgi:lipopolysaccharide cholinephosphotransferase
VEEAVLETYNRLRKLAIGNDQLYQLTDQDVKNVQACLLDMMDDIDHVCRKYHLTYAISGGAMLGAVRHGGFIPWDDDIDICMPRKDYNRLGRLMLREYGDRYWVQEVRRDARYDLNFMKIRKKGTTFMEVFDMDPEKSGVFIDIFPAENTFDHVALRMVHGVLTDGLLLACSCVRMASKEKRLRSYTAGSDVEGSVRQKIFIGRILGVLPLRWWLLQTDRVMGICKNHQSRYISIPCGRKHFFGELYRREDFYPPKRRAFDEHEYYCVRNEEHYLRQLYGDYMKLPPEEEREHHSVLKFAMEE